ncbi:hypothetical protein BMF77_01324 [Dolichospermum sp. UHCC 0315A]|jgi:hypothetical protein|uniref:hypothetical protein n=1 Tax=Dolichospermum sp. UHCC 0315A TaxID=1914871 RepID=UPI0011E7698C|nr:hypothetical protein [Dolichospermum sp. UHCC 0315A]MBS9390557.1 hypothetical protein [Dolichospermum sp. WA123]QEI40751.1 hypothetical protein BMF77_01324 [Dolichospermum sp. UHCC 0315A]
MMKKRKIVSLFVIGATVTASVCLAQISESLQAVAQPAPNIPYGIYAHQGHNYYWSNSRKFTCHVVGPVQLKLFIKKGVPSHGNTPFTPYNFQGGCTWPQGLYTPANNEGRVMYINGSREICHVSPSLFPLLQKQYGPPLEGVSLTDISKGLNNIGTCPNPG